MKKNIYNRLINQLFAGCLLILSFFVPSQTLAVQESQPGEVVNAVLFYSPACDHCHYVITETLPPLLRQYGEQLQILAVDTNQEAGYLLFVAALQKFNIESGGVPFLVIGNQFLVGSVDIPEQFPGLVAAYLAQGGIDWPEIPGLGEYITSMQSTQMAQQVNTSEPPTAMTATTTPYIQVETGKDEFSIKDRLARDPLGNGLAIVVLVGMITALIGGGLHFVRTPGQMMTGGTRWIFPALCLVGFGVAVYLAYVETSQVEAICGPVGDCNTVQQSQYARLFGFLPIGVMGVAGYILILAGWGIMCFSKNALSNYAALAVLGMTIFSTFFSVYLTFLEPFILGATCAWCLSSAIIMTVLMLLSISPGKLAAKKLKGRNHRSRVVYRRKGRYHG